MRELVADDASAALPALTRATFPALFRAALDAAAAELGALDPEAPDRACARRCRLRADWRRSAGGGWREPAVRARTGDADGGRAHV
jgi:hypothetical protein